MDVSVRTRLLVVASSAALGLIVATCGGSKPADSDPPPTTAANPAPAGASVSATPTPAATALPGMSCGLPAVSKTSDSCERQSTGDFIPQVDGAIQKTMADHPDIFDGGTILDLGRFRTYVIKNVEARGLCAQWDEDRSGHRELMVKNSNGYSEQYHIETSGGQVRMGEGAYRATCLPANFPVNPQPLAPRGDCALPSSREFACDRMTNPKFLGLMEQTYDEIARARTDLVRGDELVGNPNDYYDEVIKRFRARGFCAIFDGEEIALKNTNDFSEQYHVLTSFGLVRRGGGEYRATCGPAAF
jgi:hypothetical protein